MGGAFAVFGVAWEGALDGAYGWGSTVIPVDLLKLDLAKDRFHCSAEIDVLVVHNEADSIALGLAAEALIEALFADSEAWRFLIMEWAAGRPVLASLLQARHIAANHINDVFVCAILDMLRNFATHLSATSVGYLIAGIRPRLFHV